MDEGREHKEKQEDKQALKTEYAKLKTKYALPDFEELNSNFEIENIDSTGNILREIMREMHDTIDFYTRLLESLIQPDSKLCDMKEAGNLDEEDQKNISEMYSKCMLLNRNLLLANLDFNATECSLEIKEVHKEWQNIKKNLRNILIKMRDTWKQESKKETYGGYYG